MPIIPYNDFNDGLQRRADDAIDVPYEVVDGRGRPQLPGGPVGRPTRPVRPALDPFSSLGLVADTLCDIRRVSPSRFRRFVTASPFDVIPPVQRARERIWQSFCNERPNNNPDWQIPLSGGQCDVVYDVLLDYVYYPSNNPCTPIQAQVFRSFWGPIVSTRSRVVTVNSNSDRLQVDLYCRGPAGSSPVPIQWINNALPGLSSRSDCPTTTLTSIAVTRQDGLPDDCGDPPPSIPDYPDQEPELPPNISIDIQLGSGNTVNVPINVSQDDFINIEFGDINVDFDGINLDINFGDGGSSPPPIRIPSDPGQDGGGRPAPDDTQTDPNNPAPLPPSDPDLQEPMQPDVVIRAALVTVSNVGSFSTAIAGTSPDIDNYFSDLGTIKFRIKAADGSSGFTNPIRVQNLRAFIECPWDGGAFDVVGTPRPNVQWVITPIYDVSGLPT